MRNCSFSSFPVLHLWKITAMRKTIKTIIIIIMTVTTRGSKTTHLIYPLRKRKLGTFGQSLFLLFWNPLCPLGNGVLVLRSLPGEFPPSLVCRTLPFWETVVPFGLAFTHKKTDGVASIC